MAMSAAKELILITGATGFLGANLIASSLAAGYRVRGTVRTPSQVEALSDYFGAKNAGSVEFVVVSDITKDAAYDEVMKGVKYVFHTASPLVPQSKKWREDHIDPAVRGTTNILATANTAPSVCRVVITSSYAALKRLEGYKNKDHIMSENDFALAQADPDTDFPNPFVAYFASKILADKAASNFMGTKSPAFSLVTLHPTFMYGKNILQTSAKDIHGTNGLLWMVLHGMMPPHDNLSVHIDDVVGAHLKVLDQKIPSGERFLLSSKPYLWEDMLAFAEKTFPGMGWKLSSGTQDGMKNQLIDVSKAEEVLGIQFKGFQEQLKSVVMMQGELSKGA